jgi:hypothetical protein
MIVGPMGIVYGNYETLVNHRGQTGSRPLDWQLRALVQSQNTFQVSE